MSPLLPILTQRALECLQQAGPGVSKPVLRPQGVKNTSTASSRFTLDTDLSALAWSSVLIQEVAKKAGCSVTSVSGETPFWEPLQWLWLTYLRAARLGRCGQSHHPWDSEPIARNKDPIRALLCAVFRLTGSCGLHNSLGPPMEPGLRQIREQSGLVTVFRLSVRFGIKMCHCPNLPIPLQPRGKQP